MIAYKFLDYWVHSNEKIPIEIEKMLPESILEFFSDQVKMYYVQLDEVCPVNETYLKSALNRGDILAYGSTIVYHKEYKWCMYIKVLGELRFPSYKKIYAHQTETNIPVTPTYQPMLVNLEIEASDCDCENNSEIKYIVNGSCWGCNPKKLKLEDIKPAPKLNACQSCGDCQLCKFKNRRCKYHKLCKHTTVETEITLRGGDIEWEESVIELGDACFEI